MYNKQEVRELFDRECILINTDDVIPVYRVCELFGKDAMDFTREMSLKRGGTDYSGYGIGNYTAYYLTFKGFCIAATYYNIKRIRTIAEQNRNNVAYW